MRGENASSKVFLTGPNHGGQRRGGVDGTIERTIVGTANGTGSANESERTAKRGPRCEDNSHAHRNVDSVKATFVSCRTGCVKPDGNSVLGSGKFFTNVCNSVRPHILIKQKRHEKYR